MRSLIKTVIYFLPYLILSHACLVSIELARLKGDWVVGLIGWLICIILATCYAYYTDKDKIA